MKPVDFTPAGKSLEGTKTFGNLLASYMAESAAYSRYTFYAAQAEKEKYYAIADIFRDTADNELRHAKVFFKFLPDGSPHTVQSGLTAGVIGSTSDNLAEAAREEKEEGFEAYTKYAAEATEEGFDDVASHFESIAEIERHHHDRFKEFKKQVDDGLVWKRSKPVKWQCLVCGYISEGTEPPEECPACDHPYQHTKALDMQD